MARLPGGINQLIIEGVLAVGPGNRSGIMLDDVTVKPCDSFSKYWDIVWSFVSIAKGRREIMSRMTKVQF